MKRAIFLSLAGHTVLLMLLMGWGFFGRKPARPAGYPRTISARLVSGPASARPKPPAPTPRQQRTTPPPQPRTQPSPPRPAPTDRPAQTKPVPVEEEPRGSTISTEGQNFPFPQYLAIVQNRVEREWRPPYLQEAGLRCVVFFEIDRFGKLKFLEVEKSSGNEAFDQSGLRAVQLAAPFPPLPPGYSLPTLRVHFEFIERSP